MAAALGHVGHRVSALVDGQLPAEQAERLWAHVHTCCQCRERVEREGWIKTRVAGLSHQSRPAPDYLQSLLTLGSALEQLPTADRHLDDAVSRRRTAVAVVLGAGSVSAALVGMVALAGPAQAPIPADRRAPVASFTSPSGPVQQVRLMPSGSTPVRGSAGMVGIGVADRWVTINP